MITGRNLHIKNLINRTSLKDTNAIFHNNKEDLTINLRDNHMEVITKADVKVDISNLIVHINNNMVVMITNKEVHRIILKVSIQASNNHMDIKINNNRDFLMKPFF